MTAKNLTLRWMSAVSLAAGAALALSACGADEAQRDESTGEITAAAEANVFSLQVGDCLNVADVTDTQVQSLPTVPCADEHDGEVYAETSLSGDEYPADIDAQAEQFCVEAFEPFVGLAYESSTLGAGPLTPSEVSWEDGDRVVQCILMTEEPVTGSLEGSAI
jgi:hypothetical protein